MTSRNIKVGCQAGCGAVWRVSRTWLEEAKLYAGPFCMCCGRSAGEGDPAPQEATPEAKALALIIGQGDADRVARELNERELLNRARLNVERQEWQRLNAARKGASS